MRQEYNHSYLYVNNLGSFTAYNLGCISSTMKYGERLKTARLHAKLSQAQLAERSGTSQANVSKLEGSNASGSEFTVQFAMACGVNPVWLASEEGNMIDTPLVLNQESAEYKVQLLMTQMDERTKQQLLKISNTLVEPEDDNGHTTPKQASQ